MAAIGGFPGQNHTHDLNVYLRGMAPHRSTDGPTPEELRAFVDREVPVLAVDDVDALHGGDSKAAVTRRTWNTLVDQAEAGYSAESAGQAVDLLRQVFPTAHRAVFRSAESDDDRDVSLSLLVVFDAAREVVWYDQTDPELHGSSLVRRRDEVEAFGGPVLPELEDATKGWIEGLLERAENTESGVHLSYGDGLDLGPYYSDGEWHAEGYYESTVEIVLHEADERRAAVLGEPVPVGANLPQRRLLTPRERDVATRTLLGVLYHTQAGGPLTLAAGDQEVIEEVARVLDPIGEHTAARLDLPLDKPLTREEVAERAVDGRLTVVVAVDKADVIGADVDGYNDLLCAAATGDEYALTNIGDRIVSECAEGLLIEVSGDVREWLADED